MLLVDQSQLTVFVDANNQLNISGSISGQSIAQQIYLGQFPVLVAYDPVNINFFPSFDLTGITADTPILDIYFG